MKCFIHRSNVMILNVLILTIIITQSAMAIKCFECDTTHNISCKYPEIRDCSADDEKPNSAQLSCLTITAEGHDGHLHMLKSCGLENRNTTTCGDILKALSFGKDLNTKTARCLLCDTSKCNNSATYIHFTHILGIVAACVLFFFK